MKHGNGKQKNKTNKTMKKTSKKPGFSNSGKGYQIYYMILRSRCIVKNKTSTIRHGKRGSQLKTRESTTEEHSLNSFSSRISYSGKSIMRNKVVPASYKMRSFPEETLLPPVPVEYSRNSCPPVEFRFTQKFTGLNTSKNKAVTFFFDDGYFEMSVEDLLIKQERDLLLIDFFSYKNSNGGGPTLVVLRPQPSNINLLVHAKDQNNLELHKYENQNSAEEKRFFIMHSEGPEYVSFECYCFKGLYIGVKKNSLGLMKKKNGDEAFFFRLSK